MLLGVLKMYFLTQDTALTSQITPAMLNTLAGDQAGQMILNSWQIAQPTAPALSVSSAHAHGRLLPTGTMQVLLFGAFALGFDQSADVPFHTWLPDARGSPQQFIDSRRHLAEARNLRFLSIQSADVSMGWRTPALSARLACGVSTVFLAIVSIIYGALAAYVRR